MMSACRSTRLALYCCYARRLMSLTAVVCLCFQFSVAVISFHRHPSSLEQLEGAPVGDDGLIRGCTAGQVPLLYLVVSVVSLSPNPGSSLVVLKRQHSLRPRDASSDRHAHGSAAGDEQHSRH